MKKLISIALISSIFLISCSSGEIEEKKYFKTYDVVPGIISSKDSMLVTLEGKNSAQLSFKNPGRIKDISVKQGDIVKQGQILATLGNEEANISLEGSSQILGDIQMMGVDIAGMGNDTAKIRNALDKLYDEKIKLLESGYEKAKLATKMAEKDLELAKSVFKDTTSILSGTLLNSGQKIRQAENAYNMAKSNLDNSRKLLDLERMNMEKNAVNSLTNAYIIARNAREYIDTLLGITDLKKNGNDSYEVYLGARKINSKLTAEKSFNVFNAQYGKTYQSYQDNIVNKSDIPKETLLDVLSSALLTLDSLRNALHDTMDMLDNSITSSNFDDNTLNGLKLQASALVGNLEQAILSPTSAGMSGVKGSIEALDSFENNYDLKIKQLEDALNISQEDLNMAKTGKDITSYDNSKNISSLETNVSIKSDSLNLSKIGEQEAIRGIELAKQEKLSKISELDAKSGEIQSKLNEVSSKKSEVRMNENLAVNGIESGIIRAPFDGVIMKKMSDIGAVIGAGMPILSITSTDGRFLKTYVDNDIYGLIGGSVIQIISEKDRMTYTGAVDFLSDTKDMTNKKNRIEVRIDNDKLKYGDRFILNIGSQKKDKQIIIPLNSIVNKYTEPGVFIISDGKAKFKMIKIKESDTDFVAVEGLKVGDKIITQGKDNIIDGEDLR
ncbi:MAG: efflux RND transporter periplasmic adaptor subunit [Candidatus Gracilibacteria bacterium]|nr:efflux RND transporter periplasmic adaptor subunit [Candidatus Gracilibacteria bacterium]